MNAVRLTDYPAEFTGTDSVGRPMRVAIIPKNVEFSSSELLRATINVCGPEREEIGRAYIDDSQLHDLNELIFRMLDGENCVGEFFGEEDSFWMELAKNRDKMTMKGKLRWLSCDLVENARKAGQPYPRAVQFAMGLERRGLESAATQLYQLVACIEKLRSDSIGIACPDL